MKSPHQEPPSVDIAEPRQPAPVPARRPGRGAPDLFDKNFLRALEWLNLIARQVIMGRRQALRASIKKGASIEFRDFREYSPGDDPRSVDWLVYARLGELHVRVFRQEEDLDLWILLDRSGSMNFGEPNKFDHARRIAAALAYIGMANMDSASILPFAGELDTGPARLRGKGQIFPVLDFLTELEPATTTDLEKAVQGFIARVRRPSIVVLISDFYGLGKARAAIDRLRFFKHQIHVIQTVAPWERDPPLRGELRLVDAETGIHEDITITDTMRRRYKDAFTGFSGDLRRYAMKYAIGYDQAHTDVPFEQFLRRVIQNGRLLA
jgi:uncharacterized protein (DUF58 family)